MTSGCCLLWPGLPDVQSVPTCAYEIAGAPPMLREHPRWSAKFLPCASADHASMVNEHHLACRCWCRTEYERKLADAAQQRHPLQLDLVRTSLLKVQFIQDWLQRFSQAASGLSFGWHAGCHQNSLHTSHWRPVIPPLMLCPVQLGSGSSRRAGVMMGGQVARCHMTHSAWCTLRCVGRADAPAEKGGMCRMPGGLQRCTRSRALLRATWAGLARQPMCAACCSACRPSCSAALLSGCCSPASPGFAAPCWTASAWL